MFLPIHTDRRLRHTPSVNIGLIAANVLMFVIQRAMPGAGVEASLLLRPHEPTLLGFVGSAFLHAGWMHLLGNMLFLYIFGNSINDKLGNAAYLAFYLGGAFAAGLMHVFISDAPVLGASGAVSAVTGAYLVLFPRSRVAVLIFFIVITTAWIPSLWLIGLYFAFDLFWGFVTLGGGGGVAYFAHIGGTVFGALVGLGLMGTNLVERDQMDLLALIRRSRLRRQHQAGLRQMGQLHQSAHDIVPASAADPKLAQIQDLRDRISAAIERDNLREAARLYTTLLRVDPEQVLSMQRQIDVANQLFSDRRYADAAAAYERFLDQYDRHHDHAQTQLMVGLIYSRYLDRPAEARRHLKAAAERLEDDEAEVARAELASLGTAPTTPTTPTSPTFPVG